MASSLAQWVDAVWSSRSMGTLLLDASFKATVVLAAAALTGLLVKRGSASGRHLVWSLAVLAALCLPVFAWLLPSWRIEVVEPARAGGSLSVRTHQVGQKVTTGERAEAGERLTAGESVATRERVAAAERLPPGEARAGLHPAAKVSSAESRGGVADASHPPKVFGPWQPHKRRVVVTSVGGESAAAVPEARLPQLEWAEALLGVWALGLFALLLRMVVGRMQVRRLGRHAVLVTDHRARRCGELAEAVGIRRPVRLVESDEPVLPMTWGVFRPSVMLPEGSRSWSEERLELVLLHELAHVRRLDALTQLFAQLACAVYWFHPLIWLASRRMRALREYACDDQVLRAGRRPSEYAGELLEMVRALQPQRGIAASTLPMAQRSQLQERLMAILDPSVQRGSFTSRKVAAVVFGAALVVVPLAVVQPAVAAQPNEAKNLPRLSKTESENRVAPAPMPAPLDGKSAATAAGDKNKAPPAPLPANAASAAEPEPAPPAVSPEPGPAEPAPPAVSAAPGPVPPLPNAPPAFPNVAGAPLPPPPPLPRRKMDPEDERKAVAALKKAERLSDEDDLLESLEAIAKEYNFDEEATRQLYLSTAKKLRDDDHHSDALVAFLRGAPVSQDSGAEVLRQAASLRSDEARTEVLQYMHRIRESQLVRGPLAKQYLDAAEGLRADDDLSDALKSELHPKAVDKATTLRVLKIAERIKSDDAKEDVLREVTDHQPIDAEVEAAYQRIASSVHDEDLKKELAERLEDAKSGRRGNQRKVVRLGGKTFEIQADGKRKRLVLKLDGDELEELTASALAEAKRDMARAGIEVRRAQKEMLRDRAQAGDRAVREELERYREESRRLEEGARELKRQAAQLKAQLRERERELRQRSRAAPESRDESEDSDGDG